MKSHEFLPEAHLTDPLQQPKPAHKMKPRKKVKEGWWFDNQVKAMATPVGIFDNMTNAEFIQWIRLKYNSVAIGKDTAGWTKAFKRLTPQESASILPILKSAISNDDAHWSRQDTDDYD